MKPLINNDGRYYDNGPQIHEYVYVTNAYTVPVIGPYIHLASDVLYHRYRAYLTCLPSHCRTLPGYVVRGFLVVITMILSLYIQFVIKDIHNFN